MDGAEPMKNRFELLKTQLAPALALLICLSFGAHAMGASAQQSNNQNLSSVMSFREWKQYKIGIVQVRIKKIKETLSRTVAQTSTLSAQDPNSENSRTRNKAEGRVELQLRNQIDIETENLALARDLSVADYFVGYLTKQSTLETAIKDLSTRLSAEEVAELMSAYARHFFEPSTKLKGRSLNPSASSESGL